MKKLMLVFAVLFATGLLFSAEVRAQPATGHPPFTETQLKKLNEYWNTRGKEVEIVSENARLLGLTKGADSVRARKISGKDENKIYHLFARLNNNDGYILTRSPNTEEAHMYWVGPDFKLIAAISDSKDNGIAVLAVQDAEKELQSEYADWAKVADKL